MPAETASGDTGGNQVVRRFDILVPLEASTPRGEKHELDNLQVFEDPDKTETLWFIEDDEGGAITALLPSDY